MKVLFPRAIKSINAMNVPSYQLCPLLAVLPVQIVRRAHTRKLGAHINISSKNAFSTHFIHVIPNSDEFR